MADRVSDHNYAQNSSVAATDKLLEKILPYDEASECGVLGSMLIDSHAADIAIEELKVEDFYLPRHRMLFAFFSELFAKQESLDELYVVSELTRRGQLEVAGGKEAIGRIILAPSSAANIEAYCKVVRDHAVQRELIESAGKILQLTQQPGATDIEDLIDNAEKLIYDIADKRASNDAVNMLFLMQHTLAEAEHAVTARREGREPESPAISTHYADLDRLLSGGLWPGELIVIAGRPSMGKTTFAINIVRNVAVGNEVRIKPAAIFSLEMPREQVAKNILCAEAELDSQKMRRYEFNEEEFECLKSANKALEQAPIYIDDSSGISLSQLRARCRRLRHRHQIRLVVVDYMQLMRGTSLSRRESREQEVAEISRGLKALARDLEIPVIVVSQLNRSAERRENDDKRPQLTDLRESGAIEQDADVVIMLYRPEYYDLTQNANSKNIGEALVLKNRNGPVGQIKLTFRKDILRFDSYTPEDHIAAGA
ncbi:MAG: replicative DNA helicase [Planctomycetota bacterium]